MSPDAQVVSPASGWLTATDGATASTTRVSDAVVALPTSSVAVTSISWVPPASVSASPASSQETGSVSTVQAQVTSSSGGTVSKRTVTGLQTICPSTRSLKAITG